MIKQKIQDSDLLFDGAMGTKLQNEGLKLGVLPESLNITNPKLFEKIHLAYFNAGADVISTNTFGANAKKLDGSGYSVEAVVEMAVKNAISARNTYYAQSKRHELNKKYIALDVGPIGQLIEPVGKLTFDEAYALYKEQMLIGEKSGCDLILIETQTDLFESKIAALAALENTNLPVICSLSFEENGRTFMGTDVESMITVLEGIGVDAIGFNCSFGPKEMYDLVSQAVKLTNMPILVQPNAGLPKVIETITVYDTTPKEFKDWMSKMRKLGIRLMGGCCGTDEAYIEALKTLFKEQAAGERIRVKNPFRVASYAQTVTFNEPTIIGERLNPTGKKRLKEALKNNDFDFLIKEALLQIDQGAHVLDLNVGLPELDEPKMMVQVIKKIQSICEIPLQIDSSNIECLEIAARKYNGKPLINSVNGKEESLNTVLPIVKKYGGAVIGLTLDEEGIPKDADTRVNIAKKIIKRAEAYGIDKSNIMIDCLALTASAQQKDVMESLKAIQRVREELNVVTVLGVSNVSFGLPYRQLLNKTFLTMALSYGLTAAILNPGDEEMTGAIDAFNVLTYKDIDSKKYVEKYGHIKNVKRIENSHSKPVILKESSKGHLLEEIIKQGRSDQAAQMVEELLLSKSALSIVDEIIIPTLNEVGNNFEQGKIFLPQLIQSAETVQRAFSRLKDSLKTGKQDSLSKGKIVLATVEHDVHDIGKNIVKVILENYGFEVIDLGKDVPPSVVVNACKDNDVTLVGLSALMTSTVTSMDKTIQLIKKEWPKAKIIVGGAVLNPQYAKMIHADHYAKDARETAVIAQSHFKALNLNK